MGKTIKNKPPAPCCLLLGAGDILDYHAVRAMLPGGVFVICADGGLMHCEGLGLRPDLLVGDMDSAGKLPPHIPQLRCDAVEKDYTDSALAVEEAWRLGYRRIFLAGMLGGPRLDHTVANLQTLAWCVKRGMDAVMTDGVTDAYALTAGQAPQQLLLQPKERHYFSLLSLVAQCGSVTIEGGKYPLNRYPLSSVESPRAVSNEFVGAPVTITLEDGALVVLTCPMD